MHHRGTGRLPGLTLEFSMQQVVPTLQLGEYQDGECLVV
jgi:hypothetical protein